MVELSDFDVRKWTSVRIRTYVVKCKLLMSSNL